MKALHVTFSFLPDPPGGSELYVDALCRHLEGLGVESVVAAPGKRSESYRHKGLAVRRFAIAEGRADLAALYGEGDPAAAALFNEILETERPDIVHQHALTAACSRQLAARAKRRHVPVVFHYHTPTASCQRGTLLEWGRHVCDGRLNVTRCTGCTLHGHGVNVAASRVLARTPQVVGEFLGRAGLAGGAWTALRMTSLMRRRHQEFTALVEVVDRFVAPAPWVDDLLRANGVPADRITLSPYGLGVLRELNRPALHASARLRVAHLGRLDPIKGTDLLIRAVRAIPEDPVDLDVYGIAQSSSGTRLLERLYDLANGDPRIRFLPPVDHSKVVNLLAGYDVLAVPSQCLETGPLVVLEAFAAGVPVLGSALGGVADKVTDDVNGLLIRPHDSVPAWAAALTRCARDPDLLARLRHGIRAPRSMADAASEMHSLYCSVLGIRPPVAARRPSRTTAGTVA